MLIQTTTVEGIPVSINPIQIVSVEAEVGGATCKIQTADGNQHHVNHCYNEIVKGCGIWPGQLVSGLIAGIKDGAGHQDIGSAHVLRLIADSLDESAKEYMRERRGDG
jgi:hypothetical protein